MTQPETLKKDEPLKWSAGRGIDVWALFRACIDGDLDKVKQLFKKDPSLARCQHNYRKPLYFAVRENRLEVADYLLDRDPDPIGLAVPRTVFDHLVSRGAHVDLGMACATGDILWDRKESGRRRCPRHSRAGASFRELR